MDAARSDELRVLIDGFRVCSTCFDPFEFRLQGATSRQRCQCPDKVPAGGSRWPGYDFNEHLHLCECCGAEALPSGSKWSVWFCDECKAMVLDLNGRAGFSAIPIGRHSLMNGVGLSGTQVSAAQEADRERLIQAFSHNVTGLFGAMEHLHAFARTRRAQLTSMLERPAQPDVPLGSWLEWLRCAAGSDPARFSKEASFSNLELWFFGPPV